MLIEKRRSGVMDNPKIEIIALKTYASLRYRYRKGIEYSVDAGEGLRLINAGIAAPLPGGAEETVDKCRRIDFQMPGPVPKFTHLGSSENVKLAILICTIPERAHFLARLRQRLEPQLVDGVQIIIASDAGKIPIGGKRNWLIHEAGKSQAEYLCFADDDDLLASKFVPKVLTAIETRPTHIGFKVKRMVDGQAEGVAVHSTRYTRYRDTTQGKGKALFERTPNHLNPIRRELVEAVGGFRLINVGEDTDFALRIYPLLDTADREVFIDEMLYTYEFISQDKRSNSINAKTSRT